MSKTHKYHCLSINVYILMSKRLTLESMLGAREWEQTKREDPFINTNNTNYLNRNCKPSHCFVLRSRRIVFWANKISIKISQYTGFDQYIASNSSTNRNINTARLTESSHRMDCDENSNFMHQLYIIIYYLEETSRWRADMDFIFERQ